MFPRIIKLVLWIILLKIDTIPAMIDIAINLIDKRVDKEENKMKEKNCKKLKTLCKYVDYNKNCFDKI